MKNSMIYIIRNGAYEIQPYSLSNEQFISDLNIIKQLFSKALYADLTSNSLRYGNESLGIELGTEGIWETVVQWVKRNWNKLTSKLKELWNRFFKKKEEFNAAKQELKLLESGAGKTSSMTKEQLEQKISKMKKELKELKDEVENAIEDYSIIKSDKKANPDLFKEAKDKVFKLKQRYDTRGNELEELERLLKNFKV